MRNGEVESVAVAFKVFVVRHEQDAARLIVTGADGCGNSAETDTRVAVRIHGSYVLRQRLHTVRERELLRVVQKKEPARRSQRRQLGKEQMLHRKSNDQELGYCELPPALGSETHSQARRPFSFISVRASPYSTSRFSTVVTEASGSL
jgi:hypothetical protein